MTEKEKTWYDQFKMERCTNADESAWRVDSGPIYNIPSRCKGFFGRFAGMYFDTLPAEREAQRLEGEERDWGYGGIHEGAAPWSDRPLPPAPPTTEDDIIPTRVEFVTLSGAVISKPLKPLNE
eukprot:TRINITY_DN13853_c0_g1_i1.p1 TRINITY_DN13853_c0_g1~~TRINITY_DN13853_c0_g1_i1.p1  ORF type:complete len:123 (+),score=30.94 TRINITY_DN13853_c0_g1_i1:38-406(+)